LANPVEADMGRTLVASCIWDSRAGGAATAVYGRFETSASRDGGHDRLALPVLEGSVEAGETGLADTRPGPGVGARA